MQQKWLAHLPVKCIWFVNIILLLLPFRSFGIPQPWHNFFKEYRFWNSPKKLLLGIYMGLQSPADCHFYKASMLRKYKSMSSVSFYQEICFPSLTLWEGANCMLWLVLPPFAWENKEHEHEARRAKAFTTGGLGAA